MPSLKKIALYGLIALAVITIIFVWLWRMDEIQAIAHSNTATRPSLRVSTHNASFGPVSSWIMAEGRVEAVRKTSLQFEEAGKVVFIAKDETGNALREGTAIFGPGEDANGQLLARIDSRDKHAEVSQCEADYLAAQRELDGLRATMKQAEETLSEAEQDLERKRKLFEQKFLAQNMFDQARFRFTRAKAALSVAKMNIATAQAKLNRAHAELRKVSRAPEKLEIRAPFSGIIARMNIKVGDYFQPSDVNHSSKAELAATAPLTIIDPSEVEVTLHLPEKQGRRVRNGQKVLVSPGFEGWAKGTTFENAPKVEGRVWSVSPQIDGKRRAVRVKVRLKQQETVIPDGMFASCWIMVEHKENTLRIPLGAMLYDGPQPYTFVCENGTAHRQNLQTGLRDNRHVEILQGVKPGTPVIQSGRKKLVEGAPVSIIEQKIPEKSNAEK
ncbi:efflux RND transporter periplasmic adaptor subunit [Desulfovibrio sp. JC010]|uniref:efflux RND transporter periplasmic adaptor subunit n=1 Tax=Desulfovibrio sp. JC010 TaxID=2593641 RepID=UPI0013D646D8|nr:efflux RND transporter periplasmic adaptor subunit [Desulfovibrio sp. JC010]NDV27106.1 efflux RND transporter periplasmic adaptor subunit [Desulfovibrio sp. JC010]